MVSAAFPPVQEQGAVSASTSVAISVSTNPTIVLSTGTNMPYQKQLGDADNYAYPAQSSWTVPGQYMSGRTHTEFFNDTSTDVWIGPNINVSTRPGANYGRRLIPGSSWSLDGNIRNYFVVCGSSWTGGAAGAGGIFATEKKFVITQQK